MNKIVFIAKYPTGWLAQDGASIRFLAIDKIFEIYKRTYIESFNFPLFTSLYYFYRDIKRKYNTLPKIDNVLISSHKYISRKKTKEIFDNASMIYIENFTNLTKLDMHLIKEYGHKMVLDFHGCVIEEMEMMNAPKWKINNMKNYEECALTYIKNFVAVSNNMIDFYKNKYSCSKDANYILLPIFPNTEIKAQEKSKNTINLVYSGRNYVWQNSELMIESIYQMINNGIKNINYTFLTPDIEYFKNLIKKYDVEKYIEIKSVIPSELNNEYSKAHLGFILRDDHVVNKVSCPTKLVEYMKAGIIPVVLQPEIGDFNRLGYKYILVSDLVEGKIPSDDELSKMRNINLDIIRNLEKQIEEMKLRLYNLGTV